VTSGVDLTDAIDGGDATKAIVVARRMLDSKGRAGLQIVNILQRHYLRMAKLEGAVFAPPMRPERCSASRVSRDQGVTDVPATGN